MFYPGEIYQPLMATNDLNGTRIGPCCTVELWNLASRTIWEAIVRCQGSPDWIAVFDEKTIRNDFRLIGKPAGPVIAVGSPRSISAPPVPIPPPPPQPVPTPTKRRGYGQAEKILNAVAPGWDRPRCECGSDKVGSPGHSSYCPKA